MAEERNTRREVLRRILGLGPLAALAAAVGVNGVKTAEAYNVNGDYTISGKLGVGTESPEGQVHFLRSSAGTVSAPAEAALVLEGGASNNWIQFQNTAAGNGGLEWGDPGNNGIANLYYDHYIDRMSFAVNGAARMVINSNGYVGIGTTSPARTVEVNGYIRAEAFAAGATEKTFMANNGLYLDGGYSTHINSPGTGYGQPIQFWAGGLRMVIDPSTGNVGIGTTSPAARLDVLGDIRVASGNITIVGSGILQGTAQTAQKSYYDS